MIWLHSFAILAADLEPTSHIAISIVVAGCTILGSVASTWGVMHYKSGEALRKVEALTTVVTSNKEEARAAVSLLNEKVGGALSSIDGLGKRLDRLDNTLEKHGDKLDKIFQALMAAGRGGAKP